MNRNLEGSPLPAVIFVRFFIEVLFTPNDCSAYRFVEVEGGQHVPLKLVTDSCTPNG